MIFGSVIKKTEQLVAENATTVLTTVGIVGTVGTAVLAGRASFKAAEILSKDRLERLDRMEPVGIDDDSNWVPPGPNTSAYVRAMEVSKIDKLKLIWPQYLPAVAMGTITVSSIFFSSRVTAQRAAALAGAYAISERNFGEYKAKVQEKFGATKATEVRDEVNQDRVDANPPSGSQVYITGVGEVQCYDKLSDRYFKSTIENVKKAANKIAQEVLMDSTSSLSNFYDEIGLERTLLSDSMGWNTENFPTLPDDLGAVVVEGVPTIVVEWQINPVPDYEKFI